MALLTEEVVRQMSNGGTRGPVVVSRDDVLTPSARSWLREHRVEVVYPQGRAAEGETSAPAGDRARYQTLFGAALDHKPEHMTHLDAQVLVPKDHPRILFRGCVDSLEADLLLAQREAMDEGYQAICKDLGDALEFARQALRRDVLNEPMEAMRLGGLDPAELRARSHTPQKYYNQPHFMPDHTQSRALLAINRARTTARGAELACYRAFRDLNGLCTREDLLQGFNRLSSFLWILEIRLASGQEKKG